MTALLPDVAGSPHIYHYAASAACRAAQLRDHRQQDRRRADAHAGAARGRLRDPLAPASADVCNDFTFWSGGDHRASGLVGSAARLHDRGGAAAERGRHARGDGDRRAMRARRSPRPRDHQRVLPQLPDRRPDEPRSGAGADHEISFSSTRLRCALLPVRAGGPASPASPGRSPAAAPAPRRGPRERTPAARVERSGSRRSCWCRCRCALRRLAAGRALCWCSAGVCVAVWAEGGGGALGLLVALFLGTRARVRAGCCGLAAAGRRARARGASRARARASRLGTALAAGLALALLRPAYVTPFDTRAAREPAWRCSGLARATSRSPPAREPPRAAAAQRAPRRCAHRDPLRRAVLRRHPRPHRALLRRRWARARARTPRDAYRFARGEPLGIQPFDADGRAAPDAPAAAPARLRGRHRPRRAARRDAHLRRRRAPPGHDSLICRVVRRWPRLGYVLVNARVYSQARARALRLLRARRQRCAARRRAARGARSRTPPRRRYDRSAACRFTSFVGYEWSGMPDGDNIHRNVDLPERAQRRRCPTNYIDTPTAEGLWDALDRECLERGDGCDVLAIPHNSNVSGGRIWPIARADGTPITRDDALRARGARAAGRGHAAQGRLRVPRRTSRTSCAASRSCRGRACRIPRRRGAGARRRRARSCARRSARGWCSRRASA